jgi:hypothetical protein
MEERAHGRSAPKADICRASRRTVPLGNRNGWRPRHRPAAPYGKPGKSLRSLPNFWFSRAIPAQATTSLAPAAPS